MPTYMYLRILPTVEGGILNIAVNNLELVRMCESLKLLVDRDGRILDYCKKGKTEFKGFEHVEDIDLGLCRIMEDMNRVSEWRL